MKKTLLFVLTAFFMLFGTSAMAQGDSTLKGDVNEDGVVDVADIAAVIQIMKEAQGTQYYWYVGQENPASMTSINPIVTDNSSPGWRETGTSLTAKYTFDTTNNNISSTPIQLSEWYFALPENTGLGVFDAQGENFAVNPISSISLNGVKYNIYKTGKTPKFSAYVVKNK